MEINLRTKTCEKNYQTIPKILYKFQIVEEKNVPHTHMGKCYFISLKSLAKQEEEKLKSKSSQKKLPMLTSPKVRRNSRIIDFVEFLPKSKIYDRLNSDDLELSDKKLIDYSNKGIFNNKIYGTNGVVLQTASPEFIIKTNHKNNYDEIVDKINRKYFIKRSTVRYLTKLFFDHKDHHGLKVVGVGKIKGKDEKNLADRHHKKNKLNIYRNYIQTGNRLFTHRECHKNKSEDKNYKMIPTNRSNLAKLLRSYKEDRINRSKKLVDDVLKDLYKIKEKNVKFFKEFKKLCDKEFDDFNKNQI